MVQAHKEMSGSGISWLTGGPRLRIMQEKPAHIVLLSDSDKLIGNGFDIVEAPNRHSGPLAFC